MKRWGKLKPVRFDEKELKTDLGTGNFIFVGSSCDMFAEDISGEWVIKTIKHCIKSDNTYLFQSKNPGAFVGFAELADIEKLRLCITLETNREYPTIMRNAPVPTKRVFQFAAIPIEQKYITIEPVMDFDLDSFLPMIYACNPQQINIGADSGGNNLPEPPKEKLFDLIEELETFTIVKLKKNLDRILNNNP